jgi:hypothetical protein
MVRGWRISSLNGVLLAAYFIPVWTAIAFSIMVAPIHGLYERPSVSVALFISDHWNLSGMATVRAAWLLALARITVVAFFTIFLTGLCIPAIRRRGGWNEAFAIALALGSAFSFVGIVMASRVGEIEALRVHTAEFLMLLGTGIVMLLEAPTSPDAHDVAPSGLSLQQS